MKKIKNNIKRLLCIICFWAIGLNTLFAQETISSSSTEKAESVDINELINEHIQDSYWWHITTINDHSIDVPLPVIIYSSTSGWHMFSSSNLQNGKEYQGFHIAQAGDNNGKIVEQTSSGEEVKPIDISLTKTAFALVLNSIILIVLFLSVARWYKRHPKHTVPGGFVGAMEMFVMNIEEDVIRKSVGKDYARYSPYLLTAFFFIFINNVMGLIPIFPGGANTTGNIAITLVLALLTMLAVNLFGNKNYWKEIFWPDVPMWLKVPLPFMPLIELFGVISKPFALMIRLFANIMGGHAVVISVISIIFVMAHSGVWMQSGMTVFSVILSIFIGCLEVLVAYIQAYVFTMLSAVFIGLSRQEHYERKKVKG